jgi:hypothetical protein
VRRSAQQNAAEFLYPVLGDGTDRATNLLRAVARHLPTPGPVRLALDMPVPPWCAGSALPCEGTEARAQEDYAGNPLHVALMVAMVGIALFRWRRLSRRARATIALLVAAWALFQLTFRDNVWVVRLETPTYCMASLGLVALSGMSRADRRRAEVAAALVAAVIAAAGLKVALENEARPIPLALAAGGRLGDYYVSRPEQRPLDEYALAVARHRGCPRIGLFLGRDSYDYPLTWRAMQEGRETRHVVPGDPWPCLVVTDGSVAVPAGAPWRAAGPQPQVLENLAAAPAATTPGEPRAMIR